MTQAICELSLTCLIVGLEFAAVILIAWVIVIFRDRGKNNNN